jgi:hypothetical protein
MLVDDWNNHESLEESVTIRRMDSPYYKGIRYAIRKGNLCLSIHGKWGIEPTPSNRDEKFFEEFRFKTFKAACEMAILSRL